MANYLSLLPLALIFYFCLLQTTHSNNHKQNSLSFSLVYNNFLESLSNQSTNLAVEKRLETLIKFSKDPVEHLGRYNSSQSTKAVIRLPLHYQSRHSAFLVQVGIGTFPSLQPYYKTYYLEMDPGSGLIWTQCKYCNPCFHQIDPVFPNDESETYFENSCDPCPEHTTCQRGRCIVNQAYQDGTDVHGTIATEMFTLESNVDGKLLYMPNIEFACVTRAQYYTASSDPRNKASGVLGMNREPSSFVSQLGPSFGGRFSYCLMPLDYQGQRPPMFIRFGKDIPRLPMVNEGCTRLVQGPLPFYYLELLAISVGPETLNIHPNVFQIQADGSGGCIMDPGAGISQIINVAFVEFERVLRRQLEAQNPGMTMSSVAPVFCYKQPRPRARTEFPEVTFHFENGANFVVQPEEYMSGFSDRNPQVYCLMIHSSNGFTLLGSTQQVNKRIVYDTLRSRLCFASMNCLLNN